MDYLLDGLMQAFVLLFSGHEETYSAVSITIMVSSLSIACCLIIGAPLGFLLGNNKFPGRKVLRMLMDTLLSFPTVVIGLLVYAMLSSKGPLGELGLLFTIPGIAVGQTLLGLPIVIAMTATAVENMDSRLKPTLRTLGASPRQVLLTTLWEARFHMALAAVAAYGRIVSEIGISMMVGGNIKWHTRTITTAIALETGKGQFAMGIALGLVLLLIAFAVNLSVVGLRRMAEK
ncbi:ABC transporter permease [Desulfovibrio ferrophilus]|uniref:Binding-protein-dependent transport systems inner membrane component n=1 Tax=Desulfovibrio ferrophilus TaxID=241368 RepID=A0A2Z6AVX2_9BACT|nr:ABC transporter permease [Desulfovibrio ferrophilus]BBD07363.1 binding-protein-dependent transport systems inner membrane component [Desulfovibrio ferrophilus]